MWANPRDRRLTRLMRLLLFSFVAATLIVSLLIVLIAFVWDRFVAPALGQAPYAPRVEFVIPSILLITAILGKIIWDASQGRQQKGST